MAKAGGWLSNRGQPVRDEVGRRDGESARLHRASESIEKRPVVIDDEQRHFARRLRRLPGVGLHSVFMIDVVFVFDRHALRPHLIYIISL